MDWLLTEILTGLQKLSLLRLANEPASDDGSEGCAHAWLEALTGARAWSPDDRPAIRDAFAVLLRRQPHDGRPVFWPAPGDFLAAMPQKPAAPYHRIDAPRLEWGKNRGNQSPVAKAHCRFNSLRLGVPVPDWTALDTPEAERIYAQLCADYGDPGRAKGATVAADTPADAGVGTPDVVPSQAGPESDLGRDVERGERIGEAVGEDEYGEHLGRRSARRDLPDAWEVCYREAS